jgi:PEP-CTERM motif
MKCTRLLGAALIGAATLGACSARAEILLYGMETPSGGGSADGFAANGGGVAVSQDTIGTTEESHSLKVSVVGGATFVGALTDNVAAGLTPPLPIQKVYFDYTIAPDDAFTGAFAVVGVTVFGASQPGPDQQFGLQAQFAPLVHLDGVAPGTYHGEIDLTGATNPLDFTTDESYNDIFGSGADQLIPTGFEFFINKSNDAPVTAYFDNVTLGPAPEPASLALFAGGGLLLGLRRQKRRRSEVNR